MSAYRYQARKSSGNIVESILYASTEEQATRKIKELGYEPIKIEKINAPDRRVYERREISFTVRYAVFKPGRPLPENRMVAKTTNISAGGLLLNSENSLPMGTTIDLIIELPDAESIQCLGRVIRCKKQNEEGYYRIAVFYLDISHDDRARLDSYILKYNG